MPKEKLLPVQGIPLQTVLSTLEKHYDPPRTFLGFRTPLDLAVVTILSAQCTDDRVNMVSKELYKKYKTAKDYAEMKRTELEKDIQSCGFYRMKAKHIQEMCQLLLKEHKGKVPRTMEELVQLPGIGRKTASVILSAAFGIQEGIAVDTHVMRLAKRLGLTEAKTQDKIEKDLMHATEQEQWGRVNTLLISHGRAVCTARNRMCEKCVFQKKCPSSLVCGKQDLAKR